MITAEVLAGAVICLLVLAIAFSHWKFNRDGAGVVFELQERIGRAGELEVAIAADGRARLAQLTFPHEGEDTAIEVHAYLTGGEARQVAGWLRVAAAPGRTVDEARRRMPKGPS